MDSGSEKEQNHQDHIFADFVRKTEIPKILEKHKIDINYLLNEENFPLLEKPVPNLCADRLDYSLRTAIIFQEINEKTLNYLINNLITKDNQWVFRDQKSAKKYAELFLKMNRGYYAGLASAKMFRTVGDLIKYGLQKGYLNFDDLYTIDEKVLRKLKEKSKRDEKLKILLKRINEPKKTINNPKDFDVQVFCKSRIVDPLFLEKGKINRLSKFDQNWRKIVRQELKPKLYFLKFLG